MTPKLQVGISDPFRFPASDLCERVYTLRQPFLVLTRNKLGSKHPKDVFQGGCIHPEVLEVAVAHMHKSHTRPDRTYNRFTRTEGHHRPGHLSLVVSVRCLTSPTNEEWEEFNKLTKLPKSYVKQQIAAWVQEKEDEMTEGGNEGISVHAFLLDGTQASNASSESSEYSSGSDNSARGMPAVDDTGKQSGSQEDILVYTFNTSEADVHNKREPLRRSEAEPEFLCIDIECKDDLNVGIDALLQAAACAEPAVIRNIDNGHPGPVPLAVMGSTKWNYGLLEVEGVLHVREENGKNVITATAYKNYLKSCDVTGATPRPLELLKKQLEHAVEDLCEGNRERTCFPEKTYLIGQTHLHLQELELPSSKTPQQYDATGPCRFFEGLMLSIIGWRVTKWSSKHVQRAAITREWLDMVMDVYVRASKPGVGHQRLLQTNSIVARLERAMFGQVISSSEVRIEELPAEQQVPDELQGLGCRLALELKPKEDDAHCTRSRKRRKPL